MKPHNCPNQCTSWQWRSFKNRFQEKKNILFWRLWDFLLLQLLLSIKNLISEELKARDSCNSVKKIFTSESPCNTWSNLMQAIQFLRFLGGSNWMPAHSNYLICMCFIYKHGRWFSPKSLLSSALKIRKCSLTILFGCKAHAAMAFGSGSTVYSTHRNKNWPNIITS